MKKKSFPLGYSYVKFEQGGALNFEKKDSKSTEIKKQQGGLVFKNGGTVPCYDCGGKIKSYQKGEVLKLKDIRRENQSDVIDYQDDWGKRGFSETQQRTGTDGKKFNATFTTANQIGLGKDYMGTAVKDEYVDKQTGKVTLPGNNPVNRTALGREIEKKNVQTQNLLDNPTIVTKLFDAAPKSVKWGINSTKMLNIYTDPTSGITLWFDPSSGRAGYKGVSNAANGQDALHAVKTIGMTKNTIPPTPPVDDPKGNSGLNYKIKVMTVNPKGARVDTDLFFVAHLGKNGKAVFTPGGNGSPQKTPAITPFTQDFPLGTHDTDVLNLLNNPEEERNIKITGDLLNGKKMVEGQ